MSFFVDNLIFESNTPFLLAYRISEKAFSEGLGGSFAHPLPFVFNLGYYMNPTQKLLHGNLILFTDLDMVSFPNRLIDVALDTCC